MTSSPSTSTATEVFRAARDLLLAHRTDYDTARREFAWPWTGST
jgi:acetyl-CoA synthetase